MARLRIGSLFSGIGGLELGVERATGGRTLWNCEMDPFCRKVLAKHWPDATQYEDVKDIDSTVSSVDIITGGFPCFPAGTLITTFDGPVPIEKITEGTRVLTHKRRWRKVVATMTRDGAPLWELTAMGASPVHTTSEHPFYACLKRRRWDNNIHRYDEPEWVGAKDLTKDHFLAQPVEVLPGRSVDQNREAFIEDGFMWVPVRKAEATGKRARVYNFEVEDDNSYVAESFVVHNCQDISIAGKQAGLSGERSGLWHEYARIVRDLRPRFVFVENVPALRSFTSDEGLGRVLGDLAERGYDAEWDCVPAASVGAPHVRDRIFILAWLRARADTVGGGGRGETPADGPDHPFPPRPGSDEWGGYLERHPEAQPGIRRDLEGAPRGLDKNRRKRLRALGNAVVPQVATRAWQLLLERSGVKI